MAFLTFLVLYSYVQKTSYADTQTHLPVDVNVQTSIALATSADTIAMQIIPSDAGDFASNGVTTYVSTNNAYGYTLRMSTNGSNSDLINQTDSDYRITSNFAGSVTSSTMAANNWGYSVDDTTFYAVPISSNAATIKNTDSPVENETTTVYYGAKVNNSIIGGIYEDTVIFTAYINSDSIPESSRTIFDIVYMQDMNSIVCSNTTTPETSATEISWNKANDISKVPRTRLIDSRDGTAYIVSKLADGNCWMSQNLELELDMEALTNADTDLISKNSWESENPTKEFNVYSYNGDPLNTDFSVRPVDDKRYYLSGITPSSTASSTDVLMRWEKVGIYYNFYAISAGAPSNAFSMSDTICPRNWTLPTSNQLGALASGYMISSLAGAISTPQNFVAGGIVENTMNSNRTLYNVGPSGYYWLKDGMVLIDSNGMSNLGSFSKMDAASARCIAK